MKTVGYQFFLRITRFVTLVIRPDYQTFCLRSTPAVTCLLRDIDEGAGGQLGERMQRDRDEAPRRVARQESLRESSHLPDCIEVTMHVLEDRDDL